jgi:DMSO/TMAO reductase YedYZ molybdopterin-dependent catalytic subunit
MVRGSLAFPFCLIALAAAGDPAPTGSAAIRIEGAVSHPRSMTVADLARETQTTDTVSQHTGHGELTGSFTGVTLWTLLDEAGLALDPAKKNELIRHVVVVTGTDGYSAVLSLAEIAPEFGNDQAIVAIAQDGKPIEGRNGPARLVVPTDKAAGRDVGAIATIEVK